MTHAFHPLSGREFAFVAARRTWKQDRVFFFGEDGTLDSLPTAWTDVLSSTCSWQWLLAVVLSGRETWWLWPS